MNLNEIKMKKQRMQMKKCKAVSIEVGMQNSALATSFAVNFNPVATIAGAVFSVWHNISDSIATNFLARKN